MSPSNEQPGQLALNGPKEFTVASQNLKYTSFKVTDARGFYRTVDFIVPG